MKFLPLFLFLGLLAGCSMQESTLKQATLADGNVGAICSTDADCRTPIDYLMRSSCPFTSLCIESRCAVVCPITQHDLNPEVSKSYSVDCSADADCNCGEYVASKMERCACVNNSCVAIVQE